MKTRKLLSFILTLTMVLSLVPAFTVSAFAASAGWTAVGTCEYKIDGGTLTIRPENNGSSGTLPYYSDEQPRDWPWFKNTTITKVVIAPGVKANQTTACMFMYCSNIESIEGLENIDTSNVTNMMSMFFGCEKLDAQTRVNYIKALLSSNNGLCTTWAASLFHKCQDSSINLMELGMPDTSKVTKFYQLFCECPNLTSVDLTGLDTSCVININQMFMNDKKLTSIDLSGFDTSNVKYMQYVFSGCTSLKTIVVGDNWTTKSATESYSFNGTFSNCTSLVGGAGTVYASGNDNKTYSRIDKGPDEPGYFTHVHDFNYTASGNTVTASCSLECDATDSLSISAPEDCTYNGNPKEAVFVDGKKRIGNLVFTADSIKYYIADGTTLTDAANNGASGEGKAPVYPGEYYAALYVTSTCAAVTSKFEITKQNWSTKPTVSVKEFKIGKYDASENSPTNSAGVTSDVTYYFSETNSNDGGTEWSQVDLNSKASGTYYVYAVFNETPYMDSLTTQAFPFKIVHAHSYKYETVQGSTNKIRCTCTAESGVCNDAKEIILKIDNAVYNGKPYVPAGLTKFKEEVEDPSIVTVSYYDVNQTKDLGSSAPTQAGNYTATLSVGGQTLSNISFKILQKGIEKPTAGTAEFTYDGKAKTLTIVDSADKSEYEIKDNTYTDAGTYTAKVSLKDPANTCWAGDNESGTDDLEFEFTINPRKVTTPSASTTDYYYSGGYQIYGYADGALNYYSNDYTVSNYYRIDAGSQDVTVSLKDKTNTAWSNGATDDLKFTLTVKPLEIPVPVADPRTFVAGRDNIFYPFYEVGGNYYCFEGTFYNTTGNKRSVVGEQDVYVTPAANMVWEDTKNASPKKFKLKVQQESAYGSIYCLIDKEHANEYTDGYTYGSYIFDNENPSNVYVTTHFSPYIYTYPSNATYEIYYTTNPNKLNPATDKKWSTLKYTDIGISAGQDYGYYYIYAVVKAPNFQTYTTSPYPVFVYKSVASLVSVKQRSYTVEVAKNQSIGLGKTLSIRVQTGTQTETRTEKYNVKSRSFSYMPYAGAAMIRDFNSGKGFIQETLMIPSEKKTFAFLPKDVGNIKNNFDVPNNLCSSLIPSFVLAANVSDLSGSFKRTLSAQSGLAVTPSEVNNETLVLTQETLEQYLPSTKELQDYLLYGDQVGLPTTIVRGNRTSTYTLDPQNQTEEQFTVTFDRGFTTEEVVTATNTIYQTVTVKAGELVPKPTAPSLEGLEFKGWYYIPYSEDSQESDLVNIIDDGELWDFDNYRVVGDVKLYASWALATTPSVDSGSSASSTISANVLGDQTSVKVDATVSGTTASVKTISAADIDKIGAKSNVVIDLVSSGKTIDVAALTKDTVKAIADSDASGLEIKVSNGSVTFDQKTLDGIATGMKGTDLTLTVNAKSAAEKTLTSEQKSTIKGLDNSLVVDAFLTSGGKRISEFDGNVTVTVAVPDELKGNNINVYYLDEKGALTEMKSEIVTINGKRYAKFTTNHFSHYVLEAKDVAWKGFSDVAETAYYYGAVKWAAVNGVTSGKTETTFAPTATCTRAEFVTFLWRAAGKPVVDYAMPFTDVPAGKYYTEAVRWAASLGIVKGTTATTFNPSGIIDRAQAVTYIARFAGVKDDASGYTNKFSDVAAGAYYSNSVAWAAANGITSGKTTNTFGPKDNCERAHVVVFLYNYFNK